MASTSSGNKQLGVGFVNLKELHAKGSDASHKGTRHSWPWLEPASWNLNSS